MKPSCCAHTPSETNESVSTANKTNLHGKFTCPMHPEVIEDHPGNCPKCGMSLEQAEPSLDSARVEYTCPMHPQIIQDKPGNCPI